MRQSKKIKRGELTLYIVTWIVVLVLPVYLSNNGSEFDFKKMVNGWIRIAPFFLVFVIHNFWLFPYYFLKRKTLVYFISIFLLIFLASGLMIKFGKQLRFQPIEQESGITPPGRVPEEDMESARYQRPRNQKWHGLDGPVNGERPEFRRPIRPVEGKPRNMLFVDYLMISILVIGFNSAVKIGIKWQAEEQKNKELEKQKLKTELAFLRNQVSPHFFMNTLNNIHALIDINSDDAKASVIKLSKLMRYLLYDSEVENTTLVKEIEFINSYVDLMKLRFTEKVKINFSYPSSIPEIKIPPLLFTSLVENAFKHGVSYELESYIEIALNVADDILYFRIKNSKQKGKNGIKETGGIGLENIVKRLDLLYDKKYSLKKSEDENHFEINIKIPVNV